MKRPTAKPCAWIANVRFHRKVRFKKLKKVSGQNLLSTKKCLVWNPNVLHTAPITYVERRTHE